MSAKSQIYKEISTFLGQNVPEVLFVDKYRGQLNNVSIFTFPRPAVFISFGRFDYEAYANNVQQGKGMIRVRVVVENYADSYEGSVNQELAFKFFEINEKVHIALQGLSGTHFSALNRISDEDDEDHGNLIVTTMEYQFNMFDDSACSTKNFVLTDPAVNVAYVNKEDFPVTTPESPVFIIPI